MRARAGAGRSDTQSSPLPTRRQQHRRVAAPPLTWALRLVTCVAILLILSLVIIDVLPCFQAASLKQQLPPSRSAAVLHAPPPQPRHTSASKCEIELRLLCVIPIAPFDSPAYAAELKMGTDLAEILLDRASSTKLPRRCDEVRLYTTQKTGELHTETLVERLGTRAKLVELKLMHSADAYTNLWEKVATMLSHVWAEELEKNAVEIEVEATNHLITQVVDAAACVAWKELAPALRLNGVKCSDACQSISNQYNVFHSRAEWGALAKPGHMNKRVQNCWMQMNCTTDPILPQPFDWIIKIDLDSVLIAENFRAMACKPRFDGDTPLALGHVATHRPFQMLLGCGYAINKLGLATVGPRLAALAYKPRLPRDYDSTIHCESYATGSEDAAVSKCLHVANVAMPFARDDEDREFFVPNTIGMTRHNLVFNESDSFTMAWYWSGKKKTWKKKSTTPRALENCCATRLVLAHGYKSGGSVRVLQRLYELEALRALQKPNEARLNVKLLVQAELTLWEKFDYAEGDSRRKGSIKRT